jgi:Ferric uptake regulator family
VRVTNQRLAVYRALAGDPTHPTPETVHRRLRAAMPSLSPATVYRGYQIQEMLRTERITDGAGIAHELETYNGVLGGPGELGATPLVEIDDAALRAVKRREWRVLPEHLYARVPDGTRVRPRFDPRPGRRRSALVGPVPEVPGRGPRPVALGVDLPPELVLETELTAEQQRALQADLAEQS